MLLPQGVADSSRPNPGDGPPAQPSLSDRNREERTDIHPPSPLSAAAPRRVSVKWDPMGPFFCASRMVHNGRSGSGRRVTPRQELEFFREKYGLGHREIDVAAKRLQTTEAHLPRLPRSSSECMPRSSQ